MSQNSMKWGDTTSRKGEISRIFIGNIDSKTTNCSDLENRFEKYGKIVGIDIHNNGFAFVQFSTVEEAQNAVEGEANANNGSKSKSIVKMFEKSGSKKIKRERSRSPVNRNRNKMNRNNMKQLGNNRRYYSPPRDESNIHHQNPNLDEEFRRSNSKIIFNGVPDKILNQNISNINPNLNDHNKPKVFDNRNQLNQQGNDIEIIVINREQWRYAELLEKRLRTETCLKYIDLLFPHSPQHVAMTLKDLYQKKTLYAIVVDAFNKHNNTFTLHILHNQTEHRNVPIAEGIQLICQDFMKYISNPESSSYRQESSVLINSQPDLRIRNETLNSTSDFNFKNVNNFVQESYFSTQSKKQEFTNSYSTLSANNNNSAETNFSGNKRILPDNIAYILKLTLQDNSAQFLSIPQIDSIIEYFSEEKIKLTQGFKKNETLTSNLSSFVNLESSNYTNINNKDQSNKNQQYLQQQVIRDAQAGIVSNTANTSSNSSLLENPQLKAALNSLLQMGAINPSSNSNTQNNSDLLNSINSNLNVNNFNSSNDRQLGTSSFNQNNNFKNLTDTDTNNSNANNYLTSLPYQTNITDKSLNLVNQQVPFNLNSNPSGNISNVGDLNHFNSNYLLNNNNNLRRQEYFVGEHERLRNNDLRSQRQTRFN